jgi:hypothetical protein
MGAAIAYNIKMWLTYTEQRRKTAVISLKKATEGLYFWFLMLCYFTTRHNRKSSLQF